MTGLRGGPSRAVLTCGLLGVVPFWSVPIARLVAPAWAGAMLVAETLYAALILSFLGGARWALAVRKDPPVASTVGLSMAPTLAGLATLILLNGHPRVQLLALAAALALAWAWDLSLASMPPWYGRFRTVLTLGAVGGVCVSIWVGAA